MIDNTGIGFRATLSVGSAVPVYSALTSLYAQLPEAVKFAFVAIVAALVNLFVEWIKYRAALYREARAQSASRVDAAEPRDDDRSAPGFAARDVLFVVCFVSLLVLTLLGQNGCGGARPAFEPVQPYFETNKYGECVTAGGQLRTDRATYTALTSACFAIDGSTPAPPLDAAQDE